jgi:hypothetical protein
MFHTRKLKVFLLVLFAIPVLTLAQDEIKWKAHDLNRPKPKIITPPAQYLPVLPPSDAVVLFDGKDLSKWVGMDGGKTKWIVGKGYFECVKGSGYIRTKDGFGDVQLHVEWAAPVPPKGHSQGRGNSGVFLMGHYEVQVLDSYANETYADGQASAVYGQYPPQVNACRPPGEWQAYDIVFHRPHFDNLGRLIKAARMTVFHNGVLVQDNVQLWGGTDWLKYREYECHPDKLPLSLQDHGNPVRYRNIWLRELSEKTPAAPSYPPVISLDSDILKKYAGTYQDDAKRKLSIVFKNGKLYLLKNNRFFQMEAYSKDHFSTKFTAIDLNFDLDKNGVPKGMIYTFTKDTRKFKKID